MYFESTVIGIVKCSVENMISHHSELMPEYKQAKWSETKYIT